MRILKCHIDNFGKLSDFDMDLTNESSLKEVFAPNGWGKTTFATFLKVMFFGFSPKQGRDILENERKRYLPWNNGICGGSVVFTAGGKKYRVNRTFGKKAGDDTFAIYNADTNLPSNDYSSNLGEELFKIDRESFLKTIYVDHTEVNSISSSNSINAKLGGISDVENDLKNLDAALEKCKSYLNANSDTRKTGSLSALKEEISILKRMVLSKASLDKAIEDCRKNKDRVNSEIKKLTERQKEIAEEQKALSGEKVLAEQIKRYGELKDACASAKENHEKALQYFDGEVPKDEAIADFRETNEGLKNVLQKKLEAEERKTVSVAVTDEEYTAEKEKLVQSISSLSESIKEALAGVEKSKAEMDTAYNEYDELRQEIIKTESDVNSGKKEYGVYSERAQEAEEKVRRLTDKLSEARERKASLLREMEEKRRFAEEQAKERELRKQAQNRKWNVLLLASAALIIAGAVMFFVKLPPFVSVIAIALGVLGVALCLFCKAALDSVVYSESMPDPEGENKENLARAEKEISEIETELEEHKEKAAQARVKLSEFSLIGEDKDKMLQVKKERLEKEKSDYETLKKTHEDRKQALEQFKHDLAVKKQKLESDEENHRKNAAASAESEAKRLEDVKTFTNKAGEITATLLDNLNSILRDKFFVSAAGEAPAVFDSKILEIINRKNDCENLKRISEKACAELEDFARINPEAAKGTTAVEEQASDIEKELGFELDSITAATEELNDEYRKILSQLDEVIRDRDEITEAENRLSVKEEELAEGKKRLETVKKTKEFLEEARVNFVSRHMSPVQKGFDKYYEMLTGEKQTLMSLNAHMELVLTVNSDEKKVETLSAGYRDLIGLCYRMALADEMYENEKPFIILDDPLSNLDDDKTKHGREFIKKLAEEYQLIYLTCHESRRV